MVAETFAPTTALGYGGDPASYEAGGRVAGVAPAAAAAPARCTSDSAASEWQTGVGQVSVREHRDVCRRRGELADMVVEGQDGRVESV